MPDDLNLLWAVSQYQSTPRRVQMANACKYYDGDQRMKLATEKFKNVFGHIFRDFNDNLCPAVVDSLAERLSVNGWRSNQATIDIQDVPGTALPGIPARQRVIVNDPMGQAAQNTWNENEMDARANEVHTEAVKAGNSYVLVWPDKDLDVCFYPQTDAEMVIQYDANSVGVISRAAKIWWLPDSKMWRLNVYLPDRIYKWISGTAQPNGISESVNDWVPFNDPQTGPMVVNPYGIVPVFHFANKKVYKPGISELKDVMPIQDALNKSIIDMLVAMEFAAYRQRYIIGIEVETDETTGEPVDSNVKGYGADRMMTIGGDKSEIEVGEFGATDLTQFLSVSDKFRSECARVSGTPLHYFFITSGDFPSGEAIKSAEGRFVGKIEKRQLDWGRVWGRAMAFAQQVEGVLPDDYQIAPLWTDPQPHSEAEMADVGVKKRAIGVSRSQLLKEMGYDDDTIDRMLQESDAYEAAKAAWTAEGRGPNPAESAPPAPGGASSTARANATAARSGQ